jgi:polar amino acid transport system substrate-binding protein
MSNGSHRTTGVLTGVLLCCTLAGSGFAAKAYAHPTGAASNVRLVHPGVLSVGSDTSYPPMESTDVKHPGKFIGADVDLANALARAMGLSGARIVQTSFNSIIPALQRHNFDIIMSSMNDTAVRRKQINFVDYMKLNASEAVLVPRSSSIKLSSYKGLCGHSVSVEAGTVEKDDLTAANKSCGSHAITIKQYTADTDAFQAMASGHADAYTTDLPVALYYNKRFHSAVKFAGKGLGAGGKYGIGVAKSNGPLKAALVKALNKIRHNGQYTRILRKYGLAATHL